MRPASRYSVSPGGYDALARDVSETPYQSPSLIALAALILAVGYSFVVVLGGVAALWVNERWVLVAGTVLVPLLSVPVAMKMNVREPLGLLRIAALALAAFYAGPVGIIGLIAFPNHSPYLLPLWTLVFPLVAIGVGLAARLRIQASEGTLSGLQLTTWAVGLSLFFALGYTAYYAATYFAVNKAGGGLRRRLDRPFGERRRRASVLDDAAAARTIRRVDDARRYRREELDAAEPGGGRPRLSPSA